MVVTADEFVRQVVERVPGAAPTVREHLADHEGELLLHLLTADLLRLAIAWFTEGRHEAMGSLLEVVARALSDGDEYVVNAVADSFVEDTGAWDPGMRPFIATWPVALRVEAAAQQRAAAARAVEPSAEKS